MTQVALALVLLVGAGLMLRSFQELRALDPGFDANGVLVAQLSVPTGEVQGWEETAGFFRTLGDRLRGQPGVDAVGFAQSVPLAGGGLPFFDVEVEDHPRADGELPIFAYHNFVEPGFFDAMGIDVVEGRVMERGDGAEGVRAAVLSRAFAERWWPNESPLGRQIRIGEEWSVVVGVVDDARYQSLEDAPGEMVYWPSTTGPAADPQPTRTMSVTLRAQSDPLGFVDVLRREAQAVNPRIPLSNPRRMEDVLDAAGARTSFTMTLLGTAAGIALLLGLVGIYGVVSYIVAQRTREIGVRMALGATSGGVRGMVLRQGAVLAGLGAAVGLVAAGSLSSVMESQIFGVGAVDPATYAAVALVLISVSLVATWIPASRAARVDPSDALRSD